MTAGAAGQSIRIDRLLVYLRFVRTRSAALALIETRALRRNRIHVLRGSEQARIGDVLTIAAGGQIRVIELTALPDRRGSPQAARSHYREIGASSEVDDGQLDPKGQNTTGASPFVTGALSDNSRDFS